MIEAYMPALRRYARTLLRNPQERDDLVHDCLVRALDRWHTRRNDLSLRAWLFAIMHNLAVSQRRRERLRDRAIVLEDLSRAQSMPAGQEHQTEFREVLGALYGLPEEQRQVLILVTIEDFSYAEVAQVLQIPIGTVMSRLSRARERLQRAVDGE